MKAIWENEIIAESNETIVVESNHYFPRGSIHDEYFIQSNHSSHCPWKGDASYFSIRVNGQINQNAAWYYANPKDAAKNITGMIAFWHGVEIVEE